MMKKQKDNYINMYVYTQLFFAIMIKKYVPKRTNIKNPRAEIKLLKQINFIYIFLFLLFYYLEIVTF